MSWTPPSPYDQWGAGKVADLYAASRMLGRTGLPAEVHGGTVVLDAHRLRAYGAKLDGVADDSAAVQAAIDAAGDWCPAVLYRPSLVIEIPAGVVLGLKATVSSGGRDITLRGAGPNISQIRWLPGAPATAMWRHGTPQSPSAGYLHIESLSFVDSNDAGSGAVGLSVYFGPAVAQKCFSMMGCAFRKWRAPLRLVNAPRGYQVSNSTFFGPDNVIQPSAAIDIVADVNCIQGSFDGRFMDVMTVNYAWGWRYDIQQALEGQVFLGCNAYSGWGLCQVNTHVAASPSYKSLLWAFIGCDWQGLGFALDLVNCRNVQVTGGGGFWIINANPAGLPTINGAPRRRYMSFRGCENVRLRDLEIDLGGGMETSLALIHVDAACYDVRLDGLVIRSYGTVYAGLELEPNANSNVVIERNTTWQVWTGGPRVLDPTGTQACESVGHLATWPAGQQGQVGMASAATATGAASWDITGVTGALTVGSDGRIYVPFPARPVGGGTFFIGGIPTVVVTAQNSNAPVPAPSIQSVSTAGFVAQFAVAQAGLVVSLSYRAKGA